jgi:hypothetical protein
MTDFLTSLLERSRGLGLGLAPRIPSVFEPPGAGEPWLAGGETVLPAGTPPPSRPPSGSAAGDRIPARSREATPPDPGPGLGGDAGGTGTGPPAAARSAIPPAGTVAPPAGTVAPRPAAAASDAERELLADFAVPRAGPARRRLGPGIEPGTTAAPPAARIRPAAPEEAAAYPPVPAAALGPAPPREQPATDRGSGSEPGGAALRAVEPLPPRPGTLTPPSPLSVPLVLPERPRPAGVPAAMPAPAPKPTVHVTIGRVEIRAVTAAAPPARRSPAARSTSLDEYLAQRNQRRQT